MTSPSLKMGVVSAPAGQLHDMTSNKYDRRATLRVTKLLLHATAPML